MDVLINDENVDITLEHEKTVGEVVDGLLGWLRNNMMAVSTVTIDELPMQLDGKSEIADRPVDAVQEIRVEALTYRELTANTFATTRDYFRMILDSLTNDDRQLYAELAPQFAELRPSLEQRFPEVLGDGEVSGVDLLQRYVSEPPEGEDRLSLQETAERVSRLADARLRELASPRRELRNTTKAVEEMLPKLEETSILLQTGKESEAMALVYQFSELVSKLLRMLPEIQPPEAAPVDTEDLHGTLTELVQAFETGDTVLIGDLVEYEVVPKAQAILESIGIERAEESSASSSPAEPREDRNMG